MDVARTIRVTDMDDERSRSAVRDALRDVPGVTEVRLSEKADTAMIEGRAEPRALLEALEAAGYEATLE